MKAIEVQKKKVIVKEEKFFIMYMKVDIDHRLTIYLNMPMNEISNEDI